MGFRVLAKQLIKASWKRFAQRHGTLMSGAVAYFALLSMTPLLLVAIVVAGAVTDEQEARNQMFRGLSVYVGAQGATTIASLLDNVRSHRTSPIATVLGAMVMIYGSTRLFTQMQRALNMLWGVHARGGRDLRGKAWKQVRKRGLAFFLVLACGAFLVLSVIVRSVLTALGDLPGAQFADRWHVVDHSVSFAILVGLFAVLFKTLPDVRIAWRDCAAGGLVTAVLFTIGKTVVGLYLGHKSLDSLFGAAGSVVMLVLWAYYCAQVFFFGAALTASWAEMQGRPMVPTDQAVALPPVDDDSA